jgi:hypothetical protein
MCQSERVSSNTSLFIIRLCEVNFWLLAHNRIVISMVHDDNVKLTKGYQRQCFLYVQKDSKLTISMPW